MPLQCSSFKVIQLTSELVIIYNKALELGVYQIICSFSQDIELVLIIISNSITYCALKTYIQILKVVAAHWAIPSNIALPPHPIEGSLHNTLKNLGTPLDAILEPPWMSFYPCRILFLPLWILLKHLIFRKSLKLPSRKI